MKDGASLDGTKGIGHVKLNGDDVGLMKEVAYLLDVKIGAPWYTCAVLMFVENALHVLLGWHEKAM